MNFKSSRWATLAVAGSAQFLVLLESTIITIALPAIGARLGDGGWLPWVLSGYLLAFGGLLLPGGAWADRYGRREIFLAGLAGFALASVLCALSPSIGLLVGARVLQGAAAGVLAASALGVVLARYHAQRERAIAMTVWSTLGVIGAVVGALAAGPVMAWLGWPGVFWLNVAAVAGLFPLAWHIIRPATTPGEAAPRHHGEAPRVTAALLAAVGAAAVLAGLSGASDRPVLGLALAGVGIGVMAAVLRQQRGAAQPILPVGLLRLGRYRTAAVGLFLTNGLMIATMFAYSQHLQDGYRLTPHAASLAVLPLALASLIVAFAADPLIARLGERAVLRGGATLLLLGAAGFLAVALTSADWGYLLIGGTVVGAGLPACFVVLNRRAFGAVSVAESGMASGFTSTVTTLGGATAVALTAFGTALAQPTGAYLVLLVIAVLVWGLGLRRESEAAGTARPGGMQAN